MLTVFGILAVAAAVGAGLWYFLGRRPLCKLAIREGDGVGLEFIICTRTVTIGSEDGQTVTVSHPRVSRHHATLRLEDGRFMLQDRSEQGTRVNGSAITEAELKSGDLISLGDSVDLIFTRLG